MRLIKKKECQNEKLLRKIKEYEQKEKAKQQKSKVLGQKPTKGNTNKEERINVHNSSRV